MKRLWTRSKKRWDELLAEYGSAALYTYLTIALAVYAFFVVALRMGFEVEGAAASAGTFGAAWVALKVTQPVRIGATLLLTPPVAWVLRGRSEDDAPAAAEVAVAEGGDEPADPDPTR